MTIRKYSWGILAALFLFASCEKDTEPTNFAPTVVTGDVTNPYRFGATLGGSVINPDGYTLQEYGVQYSQYPTFSEAIKAAAPEGSNPPDFSVPLIDSLKPGIGYYYRTFAFSGYSTVYSEAAFFTTPSTHAPVFGATTVSNVSLTGFDVQSKLLDDGGSNLMMKGFVLKQVESEDGEEFYYDTPGSTILTCGDDFQTTVKDLYTGTLYAIRPFGVANGVGYGKIAYVRTLTTDKTVLSSCTFSDSTMNSVRVEAHVLSEGTHPIVETGFCYSSESTRPTVNNLTVQATLSDNTFSATLDELNSDTRYYVRAYAKSETGEYTYGETGEYTVVKHELLEVTTLPADSITHNGVMLHGYVRANNVEISEKGFCWSTTNRLPTVDNANSLVVSNQSGEYAVTMAVDAATTYYFRAYAINLSGEVFYGEVYSFTSAENPIYPAIISDVTVTDVTATSFVVSAEITDNGGGTILDKGFCYVEGVTIPTVNDNRVGITDAGGLTLMATVSPLKADTQYTICAYAVNEQGETSYSAPLTVTTSKYTPSEDDAVFPDTTR